MPGLAPHLPNCASGNGFPEAPLLPIPNRRWRLGATRRLIAGLISAALLLGCTTPAPTPDPIAASLSAAADYAQQGEYTAAATIYEQVLVEQPTPATALALADLYATWARPAEGLATLDRARAMGASGASVLTRTLALAQDAGQWPLTRETAGAILSSSPDNAAALRAIVRADLVEGNCEGAATTADRLAATAGATRADGELALLLAGDFPTLTRAGSPITAGLEDCGELCDLQVGQRLVRTQRWGEAACLLARAVASDVVNSQVSPHKLGEAFAWLGEAEARLGHALAAERYLRQSVAVAPESPLAWLLLGKQRMAQGDLQTARVGLLNAHRLDPSNPAPCLAIAELKALSGGYDEAARWIDAAKERALDDAEIWKAIARFYLARDIATRGDTIGAATHAAILAPDDAEARLLVGWSRLAEGDQQSALVNLDAALALDAELAEAHYLRGVTLEALGRTGDAHEAYVRAADLGW